MCFDISVYPVFDSQRNAVRVAVFASDITERKRAEQELERAHARTETIIRAVPDMMFVVGRDGTYIDFIPTEEQEPLFSPNEFLGRTVVELMPAELAQRTMDLIEATLESGEMQSMEYDLDTSDGRVEYECRIVVAGEDKVLAIIRDVTAQKLLAQQEERRRARDELEGNVEREMLGINPYQLTFREFTVLHLVARGEADKEIADHLGVSTFTVNKHVANILGKMKATSRTEASVRAHREGLIS
jgi:PAS domain S-box-containing protein